MALAVGRLEEWTKGSVPSRNDFSMNFLGTGANNAFRRVHDQRERNVRVMWLRCAAVIINIHRKQRGKCQRQKNFLQRRIDQSAAGGWRPAGKAQSEVAETQNDFQLRRSRYGIIVNAMRREAVRVLVREFEICCH